MKLSPTLKNGRRGGVSQAAGWYWFHSLLCGLLLLAGRVRAFAPISAGPPTIFSTRPAGTNIAPSLRVVGGVGVSPLFMSSLEKTRKTGKGTKVIDKTETKAEEQKKKEEMWRVVLHNDEVHTFNYVIRSLCKVVGTLDRKAAFEICVQTHGIGKATVTKTWKKQAEQFCLGLQRQGLTVSISPDKDFDGGHSGGGL
jgi:ATP-dependent Clp protease adapter protein ClpS